MRGMSGPRVSPQKRTGHQRTLLAISVYYWPALSQLTLLVSMEPEQSGASGLKILKERIHIHFK